MPALPVLALAAVLVGATLSAAPARADAERGRAARVLRTFVVRPSEAAPHCALRRRSTPTWVRPEKDVRLLDTIVAGWFGTGGEVTPAMIRLGISGVYWEGEAGTLTIIGLAFREQARARAAEELLRGRYAQTGHRFAREGPWLMILGVPPESSAACVEWLWRWLGARLAAAP
jgi:hypothetical protein